MLCGKKKKKKIKKIALQEYCLGKKLPECLGNHCSLHANSSSDFVDLKALPSFFLLLV